MKKSVKYWAVGILLVLIILILAAFAAGSGRPAEPSQVQTSAAFSALKQDESIRQSEHDQAEDQVYRYLQSQDEIMKNMVMEMEGIPKTGNPSLDFLNGMIFHHQSAVSMAESYLSHGGSNEKLKKMAESMISAQQEEIAHMKELAAKYEAEGHQNADKENAYLEEYDIMLDHDHQMNKSGAATLEHAFAEGMTYHHQMAVDMSRAILDYTDYDEIRSLAQNIIHVQEQEIEKLREFLH